MVRWLIMFSNTQGYSYSSQPTWIGLILADIWFVDELLCSLISPYRTETEEQRSGYSNIRLSRDATAGRTLIS